MADDDEVGEAASKSATKQGQKMENNPDPVDFTRSYPQETLLMKVQAFVRGPWLNWMAAGLILIMDLGLLLCEKESFFNTVVGVLAYVFFMTETGLKIWAAQGLWRQEGGYLRDNWNKVNVVVLGAETVDYILRVFGVHRGFSRYLMVVNMFCRDEAMRKMIIKVFKVIHILVCFIILYNFFISIFNAFGNLVIDLLL